MICSFTDMINKFQISGNMIQMFYFELKLKFEVKHDSNI